MAYEKTTWVDNVTPLSAENMNKIEDAIAGMLLAVYPVGSIYMGTTPTNPHDLFGGTWEAWGQGRVPVGVGTSDRTFAAGETGGLSNAILPAHAHNASFSGNTVAAHHHPYTKPPTSTAGHTLTAAQSGNQAQTVTTGYMSGNDTISGSVSVRKTGASTETIWGASGAFGVTTGSSAANLGGASNINTNVNQLNFLATVQHLHTVTVAAKDATTAHWHSITNTTANTSDAGGHTPSGSVTVDSAGVSSTTNSVGDSVDVSAANLQPYVTCYMWRRTA